MPPQNETHSLDSPRGKDMPRRIENSVAFKTPNDGTPEGAVVGNLEEVWPSGPPPGTPGT